MLETLFGIELKDTQELQQDLFLLLEDLGFQKENLMKLSRVRVFFLYHLTYIGA